ncbi:maleylacetoacetate isomerase [Geminicoccaceae bacterium 1502E]|nr:maleylacetoacetate isomerase [Geminicoccaceae bacterium 1502E]
MRLHDYWRSSAAWRVRIALNLKDLAFEQVTVDLLAGGQHAPAYKALNPQGLVPLLEDGADRLGQSLAIIEYLEERYPQPPLLPRDPALRGRVRSLALHIACDIHPLNNTRVLRHLREAMGIDKEGVQRWYAHWIAEGLASLEAALQASAGRYCVGDTVSLADVCLVPQVGNARRYRCELGPYPTIRRIDEALAALPAFERARPEHQPDAGPAAGAPG